MAKTHYRYRYMQRSERKLGLPEFQQDCTYGMFQYIGVLKVALHGAICCRHHYLPTPTSPTSLVQYIAYAFRRGNKLQPSY